MQRPGTNEFAHWWWPPNWLRIITRLWLDHRWYRQQIQPQFQDRRTGGLIFSQVVLGTVLVVGAILYPLSMLVQFAGIPATWSGMATWSSAILLGLLVPGVALGVARGTSLYGTCGLMAALLGGIGQALIPWVFTHTAWVLGSVSLVLGVFSLGLPFGIFMGINDIRQRPQWLLQLAVIIAQVVMLGLCAVVVAAFKGRATIDPLLDVIWRWPALQLSTLIGINVGIAWAARQRPPNALNTLPAAHLGRNAP